MARPLLFAAVGAVGLWLLLSKDSKASVPTSSAAPPAPPPKDIPKDKPLWIAVSPEEFALFSSYPDEVFEKDDWVYFILRSSVEGQVSEAVMEARAIKTETGVVEVRDAKAIKQLRGARVPPTGSYRVDVVDTIDPENAADVFGAQPVS